MRTLTRTLLMTGCVLCLDACTVVKLNPGDTTTIEHSGGAETATDLATRACRKAGQQQAEIISTVNKDPALPPGTGRQVTTFRCSSAKPARA
jgi:hypothetical protein